MLKYIVYISPKQKCGTFATICPVNLSVSCFSLYLQGRFTSLRIGLLPARKGQKAFSVKPYIKFLWTFILFEWDLLFFLFFFFTLYVGKQSGVLLLYSVSITLDCTRWHRNQVCYHLSPGRLSGLNCWIATKISWQQFTISAFSLELMWLPPMENNKHNLHLLKCIRNWI